MRFKVEFMSGGRSAYSHSRAPVAKVRDTGLFWWTIIITLLLGAAIASWFFSIYLFAYPEKPFNYRFLGKLNKLPALVKFDRGTVPSGSFYGPKAAFQKFDGLSDKLLHEKSELLRRGYIMNFKDIDEKPIYVKGDFKIYQVRPLGPTDVFTDGIVVRAQAIEKVDSVPLEYPNTVLEFIFPTNGPAKSAFNVGDILTIDQKSVYAKENETGGDDHHSYATLLNIQRLPDQKLLFTVVPLLYGSYDVNKDKDLRLMLDPPKFLNMEGRWPLTDEAVGQTSPAAPNVADTAAL